MAFDRVLYRLIAFFTSLRLTVVCLALGLVLVFAGTMAQVDLGLYRVQTEFFRSFFVLWGPKGASWKVPVMPGGYLIGGVLLINLVASHYKRFKFSGKKTGIWLVHFGLILLLVGQLLTDVLSRESILHLRDGEAKNYSISQRQAELAIIDRTDPSQNTVVAIPQAVLAKGGTIRNRYLPFTLRVERFFPNSEISNRSRNTNDPPAATKGFGPQLAVTQMPHVTVTDESDVPSAIVNIETAQGSLGSWLVSEWLGTWKNSEFTPQPQSFTCDKHSYDLEMRPRRFYVPFSIKLLKFHHDVYPGTDMPRNFSSRILLERPDTGEKRQVLIYMNHPLRYAGQTYFQASYDPDNRGSILQVVHNPSWLTPYLACVIVGIGLIIQFSIQLFGFTLKRSRRPAPQPSGAAALKRRLA
jgi:ResB-like family